MRGDINTSGSNVQLCRPRITNSCKASHSKNPQGGRQGAIGEISIFFDDIYSTNGRPSIPPEMLLKASLLQVLFSIQSERQLCERIDFGFMFRWFIGLGMDQEVWNHSTFSKNRHRLKEGPWQSALI